MKDSGRPLDGVTVVVTRPRHQALSLIRELEAAGASALSIPVIEIVDPVDGGAAVESAMATLGADDWLVVTSPNGAAKVVDIHARQPLNDEVKIAAVGPATRDRIEAGGLRVELVPPKAIAEGLVATFPDPPVGGGRVVLARAEIARKNLPQELAAQGWSVEEVVAYRTVSVSIDDHQRAACRCADAVIFTSGSTVESLVAAAGRDGLPRLTVSIGPATTDVATQLGVEIDVEAKEHSIPGVVAALAAKLHR